MHPKYSIYRDEKYLSWIRDQVCLVSKSPGPNDPHHAWNTGGKKPNDYLAVPLRRDKHDECHTIGTESFEKKYNISFELEIIRLLSRYFGGQNVSKLTVLGY